MESSKVQVLPSWYTDIFEINKSLKFKDIREPLDVRPYSDFEKQSGSNVVVVNSNCHYFIKEYKLVFALVGWCQFQSEHESWGDLVLIIPKESNHCSSVHMISNNTLFDMTIVNNRFLEMREATELELNRLYEHRDKLEAEYNSTVWQRFLESRSLNKSI